MNAVAVSIRRVRRVAQIFSEVHGQTGSFRSALIYTYRYAVSKLPRLLRRLSGAGRHRVAGLSARRSDVAAGTPLLAIKVTGGMGDYIVYARFMRDLAAACGPLAFDIYANNPGLAAWIFAAVPGFLRCHEDLLYDYAHGEYDLALRSNQAVSADLTGESPQRLRPYPALRGAALSIDRSSRKLEPFIIRHPYWDNFLAQTLVYANRNRSDAMHGMAGLDYGGDTLPVGVDDAVLARLGLQRGGYITLHNGFDPQFFVMNRRATKCYPHFADVVRRLKQSHPDLRIVQIGTTTSDPVDGIDHNLINGTSIREAAALVANTMLHIDNEGGLVHLARCFGVTSCVVFGPTPSNYFGYPGNINIDPSFCGGCWWITETWMDRCPRGFDTPRCLSEQDPEVVADAIIRFLAQPPAAG